MIAVDLTLALRDKSNFDFGLEQNNIYFIFSNEEVLYLQPLIQPKRFDIFPR